MKKAFTTPLVIILLMVFFFTIGAMLVAVTSYVEITVPRVSYRGQTDAAHIAVKLAEDWLLSSICEGQTPSGGKQFGTPFERIEAIRPDGGRANGGGVFGGFSGFDIEIYVADANYETGLFGASLSFIPRMPTIYAPHEARRFYFLRGTATIPGRKNRLISEELLAVSMDRRGELVEVTRMFYKSSSSVK
ncbi:MAG: hypothetical protein LBT31_06890 [Synergistaceae bacterium]|jgi:hypothetical protein|nr:hypothetical protein [Synergistaceae bacterium]